jgi:ribosomal protein S13
MARIAGVDLPKDKRIEVALTYIYGIARPSANRILEKANINKDTKVNKLTEAEVVRICRERKVAVQTIKSLARGPWGVTPQNRNTWYQPLEEQEDQLQAIVQNALGNNADLVSIDGSVLATWRNSKASRRFDAKLFQSSMPDLYDKYVVESAGSRRFLIK